MTKERSITILRWVARIWSIASVGLLCAFLFGEGPPPLTVTAMLFPFGVMLGLILAWWFERMGGIIVVVSMVSFYAMEYFSDGIFPKGYAFILISAPSALFLCSGFLRARQKNDKNVEQSPRGDSLKVAPQE